MNPSAKSLALVGFLAWLTGCQSASVSSAFVTSEYIHSNDTFQLTLSTVARNSLRGPPGSEHSLEFVLLNNARAAHFTITAHSDDAFMGILSSREAYLEERAQQMIVVSKMFVPKKKEGDKIRFTIEAVRDSGYSKREAPPGGSGSYPSGSNPGGSGSYPGGSGSYPGGSGSYPGGSNPGGSGSYPGGSGSYPGGSGSYPGGSGSYPGGSGSYPGGSGSYPGGSGSYPGGSGSYPGGSGNYPGGSGNYPGGSGSYPGNSGSYPGGSGSGFYPDDNHPSLRRKVSLTVEFTVTQEDENEDDRPWSKMDYDAETQQQTCRAKPGQPGCENYFWGIKVQVQDQGSGLREIKVEADGSQPFSRSIYYRYLNFPVGTTLPVEVTATASCCTQGMRLVARDVNSNLATVEAVFDGVGSSGLSSTALWGIIGGIVIFVIIIVVVVLVVVCRKKYSAVPN